MSKSFDFCISAASDKERSNIADRDFSESFELDMNNVCDYFKETLTHKLTFNSGDISVYVTYDPDADFQYFTSSTSTNDGTLLFIYDQAVECLNKVLQLKTYYLPVGAPKNFKNVELYYTVGNFVVCNEFGEQFATKEKPWMLSRTTVMMPIKYSFKEK